MESLTEKSDGKCRLDKNDKNMDITIEKIFKMQKTDVLAFCPYIWRLDIFTIN